jgi:hypothetical protein
MNEWNYEELTDWRGVSGKRRRGGRGRRIGGFDRTLISRQVMSNLYVLCPSVLSGWFPPPIINNQDTKG